LYIHSEIPTDNSVCAQYYRITDKNVIKSIITRKSGTIFTSNDIKTDLLYSRTDRGHTAKIYQKAKNKTPFNYFARNLWWKLGKWKTKKLLQWIDAFDPQIIFLASGDYSFIYDIALQLAKYKKIPLVVSCMDDYYFYNKNQNKLGGKLVHKTFMRHVYKTMRYADAIFPICEKMGRDYGALFQKPCYTLCTPSTLSKPLQYEKSNAISYIGNMGYKRNEQLLKLGRALKSISCEGKPLYIDVYSQESRPEILKDLTEENGIRFHGSISSQQVLEVMGKSMAVIHTESFDESTRKSVAYSVSTKIADSLASGTCILAYGPAEIASIEYLKSNCAAYCITDDKDLETGLTELITDTSLRQDIANHALVLARKNHDAERNGEMIKSIFENLIFS